MESNSRSIRSTALRHFASRRCTRIGTVTRKPRHSSRPQPTHLGIVHRGDRPSRGKPLACGVPVARHLPVPLLLGHVKRETVSAAKAAGWKRAGEAPEQPAGASGEAETVQRSADITLRWAAVRQSTTRTRRRCAPAAAAPDPSCAQHRGRCCERRLRTALPATACHPGSPLIRLRNRRREMWVSS